MFVEATPALEGAGLPGAAAFQSPAPPAGAPPTSSLISNPGIFLKVGFVGGMVGGSRGGVRLSGCSLEEHHYFFPIISTIFGTTLGKILTPLK